jgi:hypothetical protein
MRNTCQEFRYLVRFLVQQSRIVQIRKKPGVPVIDDAFDEYIDWIDEFVDG